MKHIKHIKQYETIKEEPQEGDYVILNNIKKLSNKDFEYFLKNTIGKIKHIYPSMSGYKQISIVYDSKDVPDEIRDRFLDIKGDKYQRTFDYDIVKTFAPTIDELKIILYILMIS